MHKPWSFEYVVRLWTDGGFQAVADQHNREVKNEKSDSSHPVSNSDSVADHAADGSAHAETATAVPAVVRGERRALPTEQDTVKELSGGVTKGEDMPERGGSALPTQLCEIAEKVRTDWESYYPPNVYMDENEKKFFLSIVIRALQGAKNADRDGNWMDETGACKVCDGEIPYGHTSNCDIWKLEQKLQQAEAKLDDNWSCKQKVIARQTETIRGLKETIKTLKNE